MTENSLNRFLVLTLIGLTLIDFVITISLAEPLGDFYEYLVLVPVCVALLGRGGKLFYYSGLAVAFLLGLLILLFIMILLMDAFDIEQIDYEQDPIEVVALFMVLIYGAVGVASWFCIRASHPSSPEPSLEGSVGELWIGLVFSILFIVGMNFALIIVAFAVAGWGYAEIIWIYYLDTLAFLLVSAKAMMKLENFTISPESNPEFKPPEVFRRESVAGYLLAGGIFLFVYAVLFGFTLLRPSLGNLVFVLMIGVGFLVMHYNEFKYKLPRLNAESPDLVKLQGSFGVRILPLHLTAMLAMLLLVADDKEMASLTLMVLFVFLKVIGDVLSEIVEFFRERAMILDKA